MAGYTFYLTSKPTFRYTSFNNFMRDDLARSTLNPNTEGSKYCPSGGACHEIVGSSVPDAVNNIIRALYRLSEKTGQRSWIQALYFPENRSVEYQGGVQRHQAVGDGEGNPLSDAPTMLPHLQRLVDKFGPEAFVEVNADPNAPNAAPYGLSLARTFGVPVRFILSGNVPGGQRAFLVCRPDGTAVRGRAPGR